MEATIHKKTIEIENIQNEIDYITKLRLKQ